MNLYSIILLLTLIIYSTLLLGVLRDTRTGLRKYFSIYVVLAMAWSLNTLLLSFDLLGIARLWASLTAISGLLVVVAYYQFVRVFAEKSVGIAAKLGYAVVAFVLAPLAILGYIPESVSVKNGIVDINYGFYLYVMAGIGGFFFLLSVLFLVNIPSVL